MRSLKSTMLKTMASILFVILCCVCFSMFSSVGVVLAEENDDQLYCTDYRGSDGSDGIVKQVSFSFASKNEVKYNIPFTPKYHNTNTGIKNTCANVAGANAIAFYTPHFPALMDGYMPARKVGAFYRYAGMGTNVKQQETINELYTKMATNSTGVGTTENQFVQGMVSYGSQRGLQVNFVDSMQSGGINAAAMIDNFKLNKIYLAFLENYNFVTAFTEANGQVTYTQKDIINSHIVAVYGCSVTNYYSANGQLVRNIVALDIASGVDAVECKLILETGVGLNSLKLMTVN